MEFQMVFKTVSLEQESNWSSGFINLSLIATVCSRYIIIQNYLFTDLLFCVQSICIS